MIRKMNYFTLKCLCLVSLIMFQQQVFSQSYTYQEESFEESIWNAAPNSSNTISSTSGDWTIAKNNVQSNAIPAKDGAFSLVIATKSNAVITPLLEKGAGILTYHVIKSSGGGRVIMVSTSKDKSSWSTLIDSIAIPQEWMKRRIEILDPEVRYVKFETNSNGSVLVDQVYVTSAGSSSIHILTSTSNAVTQTTVEVGGVLSKSSEEEIISCGVLYSTASEVDYTSQKQESQTKIGEFNVELTNLEPGTQYYYRAYAETNAGINYGDVLSFKTRPADPPVAYFVQEFNNDDHMPSSEPTSPVSIDVPGQGTWIFLLANKSTNPLYIQDGSQSNLRVKKNGAYVISPVLEDGVTDVSFYEGRGSRELSIYYSVDSGTNWIFHSNVTTIKVDPNIISINDSTVNRIKIANESGSDADIDNLSITVYPSGNPPVVTTNLVTNVTKTSAIVSANVTSSGTKAIVERGVCWSTTPKPILVDHSVRVSGDLGTFNVELDNLPAGRTIYVRAYATSRSGTAYGEIMSFNTEPATTPVVATIEAINITAETALLGGVVSDKGGAIIGELGICWSLSAQPTIDNNKVAGTFKNESEFAVLVNQLSPNTQYFYRAYALNEAGVGYGEIKSFTTGSISLPEVSTGQVNDILSYKATATGTILSTGNAPISFGVCWNISGTPTIEDNHTILESDDSLFYNTIGNLMGATKYYIRAYVTNSLGTSYGEEISFVTLPTTVLYVSPSGVDATADGSLLKPFYSLQKAIDLVQAGDTIFLKGGTYYYSNRINVSSVGDEDGGYIRVFAMKGERALLDFSAMPLDPSNQGIRVTGSYWHFYGLDIKGAGDNGMLIERNKPTGGTPADIINRIEEGHHNIVEFCTFFDNKDTGLQMKNMAEYNRVINCDSYHNRDDEDGNADGFAPKLSVGTGNYFYGCRAWNNSDDGWDGILYDAKEGFEDNMTTIYENCWAFNNGFLKDGSESKGNGNGFKLGGSGNMDRRHNVILIRCLAFDNLMKGFDQNHNTGDMSLLNCTGFSNKYLKNKNHFTYKIDEDILAPGKALTLTNCVAVWDGVTDPSDSQYTPLRLMQGIRTTNDFLTSASDYVSTDTTGVRSSRNADGSLPKLSFMNIRPENYKLIDTGTSIDDFMFNEELIKGITYNGSAPDLGCFETGDITNGIGENILPLQTQSLFVYPQPVTEHFTVKVYAGSQEGRMSLKLFNLNGKEVISKSFNGDEVTIERGNLAGGMYVLIVTDDVYGKRYGSSLMLK